MEVKEIYYMKFHLDDGFAVQFTAYEGHMMKENIIYVMTHIAVLRPTHNKLTSQIRSQ